MKRLYEVELKYYVLAEDEHEALSIRVDKSACTHGVVEALSVDSEWWDSLPFGDDAEDRTCGEIMESLSIICTRCNRKAALVSHENKTFHYLCRCGNNIVTGEDKANLLPTKQT